jgi:hypothetical protein
VVLAALFLGCLALGLWALPRLRAERKTLIYLQNHVELAAAPGEPVLVEDRWLGLAMRWVGSRAATHPVAVVRGDRLERAPGEAVLIARPTDALVRQLREAGYRVTPEATGAIPWDETGDGSGLCGRASVRIFFVLPPGSAGAIPSKP